MFRFYYSTAWLILLAFIPVKAQEIANDSLSVAQIQAMIAETESNRKRSAMGESY